MKKIVILSLLVVLMLSACSCGVDTRLDDNYVNASDGVENEIKSDKMFLITFSEGASSDVFTNFKDAEEFGLNFSLETAQLIDVGATKKHPLDAQKELHYSYSEVMPQDRLTIKEGAFCRVYDFYVLNDEKFGFLHNSDTVCFYTKPYNPDVEYPIMSEDMVKVIADEFLLTVISEPVFSNFEYEGMSTDVLGRYALLYKRYVCGYPTDETISIWIDRSGTISGYNGYNVKKYNSLINSVSELKIKLSADALLSELKSLDLADLKIAQPELIANSDGVLFVSIKFSYKSNGITIGETAYLKID